MAYTPVPAKAEDGSFVVSSIGASSAWLEAAVEGTSGGDPHVRLTIPSGTSWYWGADNSDSDTLKWGTGTAVGSDIAMTLTTSTLSVSPSASGTIKVSGLFAIQSDTANIYVGPVAAAQDLLLITQNVARVTCNAAGSVVIGNAVLATTATDGFLYIPSCAGPPTGVPTAFAGRCPLIFDSTNNQLYVYDGAWLKTAALT